MKKHLVSLSIVVCALYQNVNSQIQVYSNNNVGVKTTATPTEALEVNGNAKAAYFIGDGSRLSNLPSGGSSQWATSSPNIYYNSGNVGIGVTSPTSKLSVGGSGTTTYSSYFYNNSGSGSAYNVAVYAQGTPSSNRSLGIYGVVPLTSSGNLNYGVMGYAYNSTALNTGRSCGVYGVAGNATTGWNYGVYGSLAGTVNGAAVYGVVPGYGDEDTGGTYAGYFKGNVYMSSYVSIGYKTASYMLDVNGIIRGTNVTPSDGRLKEDIKNVSGAMASIKNLKGVTYKLKENGIENINSLMNTKSIAKADTGSISQNSLTMKTPAESALYQRNHIGFIAQDVQKVFPELVYEDKDGILSVDYVSLIPVLVESMKELNEKVEKLETENAELKKKLKIE